ncbi:MAG: hypothetical protein JRC60_02590 [Deltaproteobacteria bacterium]|nr:hypothetical protein [Deltaproteobacteria bacterium]
MAKSYTIVVAKIVHSGKKRAEQTGIIFQDALQPKPDLAKISGINPMDDVKAFGDTLDPAVDLMVVGQLHLRRAHYLNYLRIPTTPME